MLGIFSTGFVVSVSLIAAIGAQNAFVLRQGIRREHVLAVVLICALSDAMLIGAGVAGFGAMVVRLSWIGDVMRFGGAGFLLVYGALRFRAAWRGGEALLPAASAPAPLGRVVATCLALTWGNPHVYLDTLGLLGSLSTQYAPWGAAFGAGAATGSLVFFTALGFGARLLAPVFAQARAWVVLEVVIGVTMWAIAAGLMLA